MNVEKTYRGIPARLAVEYLERLGGERVEDGVVEGAGWRAVVEEGEAESIGPSLSLTPVHVSFEGDPGPLEELIEDFSKKAMRAGG